MPSRRTTIGEFAEKAEKAGQSVVDALDALCAECRAAGDKGEMHSPICAHLCDCSHSSDDERE